MCTLGLGVSEVDFDGELGPEGLETKTGEDLRCDVAHLSTHLCFDALHGVRHFRFDDFLRANLDSLEEKVPNFARS